MKAPADRPVTSVGGPLYILGPLFLIVLLAGQGCNSDESVVYKELSQDSVEGDTLEAGSAATISPPEKESPVVDLLPSNPPTSTVPSPELTTSDPPASAQSAPAEKMTEKPAGTVTPDPPSQTSSSSVPRPQVPSIAMIKAGGLNNPAVRPDTAMTVPLEEVPLEPREPELLIPEKTFRQEGPEGALRVTFDDLDLLKVLNMEPVPENAVEMFPEWLRDLDGKRVLIRGFMFPTLTQTGITYFQHVRDNEICCFGRTPKVYDRISTVLRTGKPTHYIQGRPFDVIGTLRIDPVYEDGEWLQLYLLEDAIVLE